MEEPCGYKGVGKCQVDFSCMFIGPVLAPIASLFICYGLRVPAGPKSALNYLSLHSTIHRIFGFKRSLDMAVLSSRKSNAIGKFLFK